MEGAGSIFFCKKNLNAVLYIFFLLLIVRIRRLKSFLLTVVFSIFSHISPAVSSSRSRAMCLLSPCWPPSFRSGASAARWLAFGLKFLKHRRASVFPDFQKAQRRRRSGKNEMKTYFFPFKSPFPIRWAHANTHTHGESIAEQAFHFNAPPLVTLSVRSSRQNYRRYIMWNHEACMWLWRKFFLQREINYDVVACSRSKCLIEVIL